ncbi:MAG: hypothetical protein OES24_07590 [Acidimicrobiia bacterium]|nr:hypothetical protein [Acidimicrobiia bacterium]
MLVAACGADINSAEPTTAQSNTSAAVTSTGEVSTPPSSTTSTATPTTETRSGQLVLRPDGLGDLDFGEPTASAMEVLVGLLGQPDPGEEYPYGGHPLRHVYWENVGLAVVFSDYEFFRDDGEEHFAGWGHGPSSLPLKTIEGIGIDSTLGDLQTAYPGMVDLVSECDPGGPATAAYVRGRVSSIRFGFRELPLEPASRIGSIDAGAGPGC